MGYHSPITDPHRDWLDERNRLLAIINDPTTAEIVVDSAAGKLNAIDDQLLSTPARTADGLAAKMLTVLQDTIEGHEIDDERIADVIREAQTILDMGSLAGAPAAIQDGC